ncbi:hypothetical protein [Novosphingobium sp. KA1]|uniref:hypothetical protein n=1 Tax=Novosphingobium sp. (strain KA1) TaxID=164608 RepID=UPI001A8F5DB3|nr:hypothetical protein [Novosphingobium sp. KA1]
MNRAPFIPPIARAPAFLACGLALAAVSAGLAPAMAKPAPPPVPGGTISTLPLGHYTCEKDGDAGGAVGNPVPALDFQVVNFSSYKGTDGVRGSYLMTGDSVTMTGGKLKGEKLHRTAPAFLRVVGADGQDSEIRCVLTSRKRQSDGGFNENSPADSGGDYSQG